MNEQLADIPGTISPEAKCIQWCRNQRCQGYVYEAILIDGMLTAIVSHDPAGKLGKLLWHVSVSHRDAAGIEDRCPTWDELKHAKYQLVPADVPMVLVFPRKTAPYVNTASTCLHLWESEEEIDL